MKVAFEGRLSEVYFGSQDDRPTLVINGVQEGTRGKGVEGPVEVIVAGTGLQMDGLVVGEPVRVLIETLPRTSVEVVGHHEVTDVQIGWRE